MWLKGSRGLGESSFVGVFRCSQNDGKDKKLQGDADPLPWTKDDKAKAG